MPTVGCALYTTQPTTDNCPTASAVISGEASLGDSGASGDDLANNGKANNGDEGTSPTDAGSVQDALPSEATIDSSESGAVVLNLTWLPTTYSEYTSLTEESTVTTTNDQNESTTFAIGPAGIGWTPVSAASTDPNLAPPTALPVVPQAVTQQSDDTDSTGASTNSPSQTSAQILRAQTPHRQANRPSRMHSQPQHRPLRLLLRTEKLNSGRSLASLICRLSLHQLQ